MMTSPLKIGIAADHAGFTLKEILKKTLIELNHSVIDYGTFSTESVDYPDYAHQLAKGIITKEVDFGIILCGTGNGMVMVMNRYDQIRAGICWIPEIAMLIKAHNNANVCVLPARFITQEVAIEIIKTFLLTDFEGGRHQNRINKINRKL